MSGTPQTTVVDLGVPVVWTNRGDMGRTETFTQTDLSLSHTYKFGRDNKYSIIGNINFDNVFNENNVTALDPERWLDNFVDPEQFAPGCNFNADGFNCMSIAQNAIINGAAKTAVTALDVQSNRNIIYGLPSAYQSKRSVRFGFRFVF